MYTLSNNMSRQYTINVKTGFDEKSAKPLVKKYRLLPGVAGEIEIEDNEAKTIKELGGVVENLIKSKKLELTKVVVKTKAKDKKDDDESIAS